ncbi:pyridoxal phosphate-dependent aminotransferase [Pedobacter endophyticus]|uniref:Histidinol-phosphate aminotransferase family protein n=1 Tax=Pedobacter endophyticus TaxID=2789740 RepID=A0A7S9PYV3_9SPHI|nr:histidinol-phosphate transaminase [Pedobacter endophyticus]QPH38947.1 histidinol-phosphate aminotransferase family protein [Pedobacter endophyticus]
MIFLTELESQFYSKFSELKSASGSHSPSIHQLIRSFPNVKIDIDACYLCNPYAFDLFMDYFVNADIEKYIRFYPALNSEIAKNLSVFTGIPSEKILVGNGAIELISSLFSQFKKKKILMVLPAFSAYQELAEDDNIIIPYYLTKEYDFKLNVDDYLTLLLYHKPDVILIINPNNPTGTLIKRNDLIRIHTELTPSQLLIVDESFIHFTAEEESIELYATDFNNIIIIRSLSKDFGIAGVRIGYAVMPENYIVNLQKTGYLWNSNGFAQFFSELLTKTEFQRKYAISRLLYHQSKNDFFVALSELPRYKVYPSEGNFFLIETMEDPSFVFTKLLFEFGIYCRLLSDKVGLKGNFIRIASKNQSDNHKIILALKSIANF